MTKILGLHGAESPNSSKQLGQKIHGLYKKLLNIFDGKKDEDMIMASNDDVQCSSNSAMRALQLSIGDMKISAHKPLLNGKIHEMEVVFQDLNLDFILNSPGIIVLVITSSKEYQVLNVFEKNGQWCVADGDADMISEECKNIIEKIDEMLSSKRLSFILSDLSTRLQGNLIEQGTFNL